MRGGLTSSIRRLHTHLGETLFRAAPAGGWPGGRLELAVFSVCLVVLAVVLQLLRVGPELALNAFWAEDGGIFFRAAVTHGFFDAVTTPYAEYLVVVPRLIAELGTVVPLRDAPVAVALAATTVVGLSGLAIWHASSGLIRSPFLRGVLVAATVLSPVASLEAVASGAYTIWFMLPATFWLLLWRPRTNWGAGLGGLFILATALSTPGVWFFAPVAGLRLIAARDRRDALLLGGYVLGAAIQVPVVASSTEGTVGAIWTSDIWVAYAQRVLDAGLLGESVGGRAWESMGSTFLILLVVALAVGFVVLALRAAPAARYLAAIAVPTSLAMFVASAYQRAVGTAVMWPADLAFGVGGRYTIVPALLLLGAALAMIDQPLREGAVARGRTAVAIAASCVALFAVATSFGLANEELRGKPSWTEALDSSAAACTAEQLERVTVPTQPVGFGVSLPCDEVVAASAR